MMNSHISTTEAKQDKLFYIVANIAIVNTADATVLILKRSASEKVHPGKWAFPGGKLEHADVARLLEETGAEPIDGIDNIMGLLAMREAKEECGLTVDASSARILSDKVFVRPDGIPVFMTIMATGYSGGEVVLEEGAFSEYTWVSMADLSDYDLITGLARDIEAALAAMRK
jgi:8-oxo-dGTP pyrophosphatase MutT (NUDIX family)